MTRSFVIVPQSKNHTFWLDRAGFGYVHGDARAWAKKRERHLQRRQFRKITEAAMQDYYDEIEDVRIAEFQMWADAYGENSDIWADEYNVWGNDDEKPEEAELDDWGMDYDPYKEADWYDRTFVSHDDVDCDAGDVVRGSHYAFDHRHLSMASENFLYKHYGNREETLTDILDRTLKARNKQIQLEEAEEIYKILGSYIKERRS